MRNRVAKDPSFPMEATPIKELKNTANIAERVKSADLLITRNGETVGYMVNPIHYEAMVEIVADAGVRATEQFLRNYAKRNGDLGRLDSAWAASLRGEWATVEEEAEVFGE